MPSHVRHSTVTPFTPLSYWSTTRTTSGSGSSESTGADWLSPEILSRLAATSGTAWIWIREDWPSTTSSWTYCAPASVETVQLCSCTTPPASLVVLLGVTTPPAEAERSTGASATVWSRASVRVQETGFASCEPTTTELGGVGTMEMWATVGRVIWPDNTWLDGLWLAKRSVRAPGAPMIARSAKSARP